ncbi:MAG: hypothetical protein ABI854_05680, partial [Betaproteobacteria bacterium]
MTDKVGRATGFIALWCLALSAQASFHTFQFNELYSNADGNIQFVELRESQGAFGQNFLGGVTLTSSNGATQKSFTFDRNLPSSATAGTFVLIATQGFAALGLVTPDYIVPDGFFPLGSGTLNYDGVDTLTYSGLPADGTTSISRSGVTQTNSPRNFAGASASVTGPQTGVVEFYNTTLNHFFVTADPVERASIDAGGSGPGWTRTGNSFKSGGP